MDALEFPSFITCSSEHHIGARVINLVLASISSSLYHPVQHRPTFSISTASHTSSSCPLTLLSWPQPPSKAAPASFTLLVSSPQLLHTSIFLIPSTPAGCPSLPLSLWTPTLHQVAPVPRSRASSWLMSSLGPELCQGVWHCSGQTGRASGGPWWSLGTGYGHWRRDRKVPACPTCRYSGSVSILGAGDCYFGH